MSQKILLKNATIVSMSENYSKYFKGSILVENNKISKIFTEKQNLNFSEDTKVFDLIDKVILPGFINCHTHAAMTLVRGIGEDVPLDRWLKEKIWPVEKKLTYEDVLNGSILGMAEMLLQGTTTINDMYLFVDASALAANNLGIRAVLGNVAFEHNFDDVTKEIKSAIDKYKGNERIKFRIGPHSPQDATPELIKKIVSFAKENTLGIHTHMGETLSERNIIMERYGISPVELYDQNGLFDLPVVAAHGIHLTSGDIEILSKRGVNIAHNPRSNCKLGSGIAPIVKMIEAGVNIALGTDGAASNNRLDIMDEAVHCLMLQRVVNNDPSALSSFDVVKMLTINGAKALGMENEIGKIQEGYCADFVVFNTNKPYHFPKTDILDQLVFSSSSRDICHVMVNGEWKVRDSKLQSMDLDQILLKFNLSCSKLGVGI